MISLCWLKSRKYFQAITHDTQMHLLLLSELVYAPIANDPETFKRWVSGGIQDLGKPAIEELMIEKSNPLLTQKTRTGLLVSNGVYL